ncbi:MAG: GNAT family N-acetyltransferase [Parvularculaceae bacterium]|nr:GNAT family N-acetyltransferase [Parvularculaceae bacterium]
MSVTRETTPAGVVAEDAAPMIAAVASFIAGAATLIAAANPDATSRTMDVVDLIAIEAPGVLAALIGIAQMAIADGLRRRVDASLWGAIGLSALAAIYFVLRHERYLDASLQIAFVGFLLFNRRAFYRRARAFRIRVAPGLLAGIGGVVLIAALAATLWASTHHEFRLAPWWSLLIDAEMGRGGRVVALAAVVVAGWGLWRTIAQPERPHPPSPKPEDLAQANRVLTAAEESRPEHQLAFTGDLSLMFSETGQSFLPYAAAGSSLVALCGPAGRRDEQRAMIARFCDRAEDQGRRPVLYSADAALLPVLLDLGFKVEKIGESAVIDLETFSLAGKARENIRHCAKKMTQREGATFEIHEPPHGDKFLDLLRPISDAWLEAQKTGEKGFSLGRFDAQLLDRCPIGVARINGRVIAFGTLLATEDRRSVAIDLMRYDQATAPSGAMDFLLVELILWAKEAGYKKFDLSMAPLSGLAEERHAPLFARLGRMIYEQGGRWYNFEGLRRFKEKFRPDWEPRYIAAKGVLSVPVALAEIAMLTNAAPKEREAADAPLTDQPAA